MPSQIMANPTKTEKRIGVILRQRGLSLATAESCTGGLVSDRITDIPGSSVYFRGGIVAYSNAAKISLLGVSPATLESHGAVSSEVVLEMARGARRILQADLAVSISGVAGPGGGTPDKPVGTTWIGLSAPDGEWSRHLLWRASRRKNKESSAQVVLDLLFHYLQGQPDHG